MKKSFLSVLIILSLGLFDISLKAQTLTLTAGTVCADSIVSVPIHLQNAQNVYGFKLRLQYNKNLMTYTGFTIIDTALSNTIFTDLSSAGQVGMELMQDSFPLNIQNADVILLNFTMTSQNNTLIIWDTVHFWGQSGNAIQATQIYGAVVMPPLITLQPTDGLVCEGVGNTVNFSMQAVGTMHTYQWQLSQNGGTVWADLTNNIQYQGVTTPTLSISSPALSMNNYLYRCKLSGYCSLLSEEASLIILSDILTHPHDTLVNAGGTAFFHAEGTGSFPAYLWEISTDGGFTWSSNTLFPSVTTPEITLVGVPLSWSGYKFRCIVGGQCSPPSTTTNAATLLIGAAGIEDRTLVACSIYPNPAEDNFRITINSISTYSFLLYDITGRCVKQINNFKTNLIIIPRQNLDSGIYFYRLIDEENYRESTGKVIFK